MTEFTDGTVIVEATYGEHLVDEPKGRAMLRVTAPDRATARRGALAICHALRVVVARGTDG
ncbi:MAG: hypothetical protein IT374_26525 [Polyangiaceae bacterium]|nr:hypothetical protein [Polyangiaceae bacterium]